MAVVGEGGREGDGEGFLQALNAGSDFPALALFAQLFDSLHATVI